MIDARLMNYPNCHSERSARATCPRSFSRPRGHEVEAGVPVARRFCVRWGGEESLFVWGSKEGGILRRSAPQNDRLRAFRGLAAMIGLAVLAAAPLFAQAPVQSTDRAKALGKQIMCTCSCGDTAGSCSHPGAAFSGPCEVLDSPVTAHAAAYPGAKGKLKEINERISRGESNESILQSFIQEYGEAVLAAPPARGFNWFAYTFPAVAFAIGVALVIMIIRQWRHRPQMAPASGPAVSAEMLEHARRQIERDVQDD
jgi:cytochrome c-type biogenesis CcmH protein